MPGKLWLAGEGTQPPELVKRMYQTANAEQAITVLQTTQAVEGEAVKWLLSQKQ